MRYVAASFASVALVASVAQPFDRLTVPSGVEGETLDAMDATDAKDAIDAQTRAASIA